MEVQEQDTATALPESVPSPPEVQEHDAATESVPLPESVPSPPKVQEHDAATESVPLPESVPSPPRSVAEGSAKVSAVENVRSRRMRLLIQMSIKCLKISCSNLGLFLSVMMYSLLGGYIFASLESPNEQDDCQSRYKLFVNERTEAIKRLLEIAEQGLDARDMGNSYEKILNRFNKDSYKVNYDGANCSLIGLDGGNELQWSLAGSTLFATTIITTIGKNARFVHIMHAL